MKILDRVGEKYQLLNGEIASYDELDTCEKIRLYQKEHGCDLETATVEVLGSEEGKEKLNFEKDSDQSNITKVNDQYIEEIGREEDLEIKKYMSENDCDYESAMLKVYENKASESEENRFSAYMSGNDSIIVDSETGKKIKVPREAISKYENKNYCSYQEAESVIVSNAIAELKQMA